MLKIFLLALVLNCGKESRLPFISKLTSEEANKVDSEGITPLIRAALREGSELVEDIAKIIDAGANESFEYSGDWALNHSRYVLNWKQHRASIMTMNQRDWGGYMFNCFEDLEALIQIEDISEKTKGKMIVFYKNLITIVCRYIAEEDGKEGIINELESCGIDNRGKEIKEFSEGIVSSYETLIKKDLGVPFEYLEMRLSPDNPETDEMATDRFFNELILKEEPIL